MAIGTENAFSGPYTANGVTTEFPFTFIFATPVSLLIWAGIFWAGANMRLEF